MKDSSAQSNNRWKTSKLTKKSRKSKPKESHPTAILIILWSMVTRFFLKSKINSWTSLSKKLTTRSGPSSLSGLTSKSGSLLKNNPAYKKSSPMQTWSLTQESLLTTKLKGMKKVMLYDSSVQDRRISIKTYSFNDFNVCVYLLLFS